MMIWVLVGVLIVCAAAAGYLVGICRGVLPSDRLALDATRRQAEQIAVRMKRLAISIAALDAETDSTTPLGAQPKEKQ